jgi:hypothetical protein
MTCAAAPPGRAGRWAGASALQGSGIPRAASPRPAQTTHAPHTTSPPGGGHFARRRGAHVRRQRLHHRARHQGGAWGGLGLPGQPAALGLACAARGAQLCFPPACAPSSAAANKQPRPGHAPPRPPRLGPPRRRPAGVWRDRPLPGGRLPRRRGRDQHRRRHEGAAQGAGGGRGAARPPLPAWGRERVARRLGREGGGCPPAPRGQLPGPGPANAERMCRRNPAARRSGR